MTIEHQLRALGTHVDRVQVPITVDDLRTGAETSAMRREFDGHLIVQDTNHHQVVDDETEIFMLSPEPKNDDTRRRTWLAVAAAVAALIGVAGLVMADRSTDDSVADEPNADPTDSAAASERDESGDVEVLPDASAQRDDLAIGAALLAGLDAGDADAVVELFHDDAIIELNTARSVAEIPAVMDYWEIEGAEFAVESCEPSNSYPVVCTAVFRNKWVTAADEPVTVSFHIRVDDDRISQLGMTGSENYGPVVVEPYWNFIGDQSPEDLSTMIADDPDSPAPLGPALDDNSLALHERYIAAFVEQQTTAPAPTPTTSSASVVTLAEEAATEDPAATAVDPPDTADTAPPVEEASEETGERFEMFPLPEGATAEFSESMLFDPQDGQCSAWLAEARPLSPGVEYPEGTVGSTTVSVDSETTTTVFRCEDGEWVHVGERVTTGNS